MILNNSLLFDELEDTVRHAFRGPVEPVVFAQNHLFYKLSWGVDLFSITPWWSSYEPAIHGDLGFNGAWNHPLGIKNYVRINAAVSLEWNALDKLVMMRLRTPVRGFVGRCERQPAQQNKPMQNQKFGSVMLAGGQVQVYLPNLHVDHIEMLMETRLS